MTLKRVDARASTSMTATEIDNFRTEKVDLYGTDNITGFILVDEGDTWITIEGDATTITNEIDSLSADSRFSGFKTTSTSTPSTRRYTIFVAHWDGGCPKKT